MKGGLKEQKGYFHRNNVMFHPALMDLNYSAFQLLHSLLSKLEYKNVRTKRGKEFLILNNGELIFTENQYRELTGKAKQTYLNSRNMLIRNGIIEIAQQGGQYRGDATKYRVLITKDIRTEKRKWLKYPNENFEKDVPKNPKQKIGKKTRITGKTK